MPMKVCARVRRIRQRSFDPMSTRRSTSQHSGPLPNDSRLVWVCRSCPPLPSLATNADRPTTKLLASTTACIFMGASLEKRDGRWHPTFTRGAPYIRPICKVTTRAICPTTAMARSTSKRLWNIMLATRSSWGRSSTRPGSTTKSRRKSRSMPSPIRHESQRSRRLDRPRSPQAIAEMGGDEAKEFVLFSDGFYMSCIGGDFKFSLKFLIFENCLNILFYSYSKHYQTLFHVFI